MGVDWDRDMNYINIIEDLICDYEHHRTDMNKSTELVKIIIVNITHHFRYCRSLCSIRTI